GDSSGLGLAGSPRQVTLPGPTCQGPGPPIAARARKAEDRRRGAPAAEAQERLLVDLVDASRRLPEPAQTDFVGIEPPGTYANILLRHAGLPPGHATHPLHLVMLAAGHPARRRGPLQWGRARSGGVADGQLRRVGRAGDPGMARGPCSPTSAATPSRKESPWKPSR